MLKMFKWSVAPVDATPTQRKNFLNVQIDAIGIGLASAAAPFLPVFLARLGATNFQVGLLTAMPAFTGLCLSIIIGHFLQRRRNIVPWFSGGRLLTVLAYALTGLVPFFMADAYIIPTVLLIWAVATVPQTVVAISFSVVMSTVAGPSGRYDLMSRRWSILGLTTAISVAVVSQVLEFISFPVNYQLIFMGLSIGGLISFYYSNNIRLPEVVPQPKAANLSAKERLIGYYHQVRAEREFVSFTSKQFVYTAGMALAVPLFPLYYVHELQASDSWIGLISSVQTAVVLVGYVLWSRQSRRFGGRHVLLWTTCGMAIYPMLAASTGQMGLIVLLAGLAGIFQAGLSLVFFDELMKTIPDQRSATFVSLSQSVQYLATMAGPLLGTLLADQIGLGNALIVSGVLRLMGFGLFALDGNHHLRPRRWRKSALGV